MLLLLLLLNLLLLIYCCYYCCYCLCCCCCTGNYDFFQPKLRKLLIFFGLIFKITIYNVKLQGESSKPVSIITIQEMLLPRSSRAVSFQHNLMYVCACVYVCVCVLHVCERVRECVCESVCERESV